MLNYEAYFMKLLQEHPKEYDFLARCYAETFGIVLYKVKGSKMIYNVSYNATHYEPRSTYQFTVDLNTMKSGKGVLLKRYDSKAVVNRH